MKTFGRKFARVLLDGITKLPEDAQPQWGKMNWGQLIAHCATTLRYTIGEGPELPFKGTFLSKTFFKFMILNGFREIPQDIRLPRPADIPPEQWFQEAPLETLQAAIDAYFSAADRGELPTRIHPFFGPLSAREWRKMHARHFRHHMKQFKIDPDR